MTDQKTQPDGVRLLDQVRGKIRLKHYSIRTEQTYIDWIRRFILHFGKRHPRELGASEVEAFLTYLAVEGRSPRLRRIRRKARCCFCTRRCLRSNCPGSTTSSGRRCPSACQWC
ncbi:MAG: phage integrase N-terminal SAM-like domain-containing protein [Rhodocyclales bacterium]|nr:phage integrase N-terminal SAM-like domain-containing protein [Rhodocyclales bacterium]